MAQNNNDTKQYLADLIGKGYGVKKIVTESGNKMLAFFDRKTKKFAMILPASAKLKMTISKVKDIVAKYTQHDSSKTSQEGGRTPA